MAKKKIDTINRLRADGNHDVAKTVDSWRNSFGNNSGWDSWFASQYPQLASAYAVGHTEQKDGKLAEPARALNKVSKQSRHYSSKNHSMMAVSDNKVETCTKKKALETISELSHKSPDRQFDVYCFADYRGDKGDTSGGIAVVLGIAGKRELFHVTDIVRRKTLAQYWRDLISELNKTGSRLIFGQDHQYGVPKKLLDELRIQGPWRESMNALFESQTFCNHASNGNAGGYAKAFNDLLRSKNQPEYFYSATKGKDYGIPVKDPRPEDLNKFRHTERNRVKQPFPFNRVGDNGSVGGQTIVGIPNLLQLLSSEVGPSIFAWPFDGVELPSSVKHVLVEVYPSALRRKSVPQSDLNDAIACVEWCMAEDAAGRLRSHLSVAAIPRFKEHSDHIRLEGWYFGID